MFDSWESQLDMQESYARENPGAFLVWIEGIVETSNLYTAGVMALDLDDGRPWPALANELDPNLRERDRAFWQRVGEVLREIKPRLDDGVVEELLAKIGDESLSQAG